VRRDLRGGTPILVQQTGVTPARTSSGALSRHVGDRADAANLDLRHNARTKFEKLIRPGAKPVAAVPAL
jgi:hypothetical protein